MKQHILLDAGDVGGAVRNIEKVVTRAFNTLNNAAGQTLTAAQLVGGFLDRLGAAGVSDTTPTAAQIIAAIPGVAVGDVIEWRVRNRNTGTLTLVAGSGVTLEGTTTIPTVNTRWYAIRVTSLTAVTISGMAVAAN